MYLWRASVPASTEGIPELLAGTLARQQELKDTFSRTNERISNS